MFCSFNNSYKITPEVFDIWMRLLQQVNGSVLWLLQDNPAVADNLRREAAARGVAPERLVFAERLPPDEHLARHRCADLFLDTWPVNAHTTASDALWAGLPMITLLGSAFAGRVAASLLHAIGQPGCVAADAAGYEALALALARNPARLSALRHAVQQSRESSALFDTPRFTRHIEQALRTCTRDNRPACRPNHSSYPSPDDPAARDRVHRRMPATLARNRGLAVSQLVNQQTDPAAGSADNPTLRPSPGMAFPVLRFLTALVATLLVVRLAENHRHRSAEHDLSGQPAEVSFGADAAHRRRQHLPGRSTRAVRSEGATAGGIALWDAARPVGHEAW